MAIQRIEILAFAGRHIHLCDVFLRAEPYIFSIASHAHYDILHGVDALNARVIVAYIEHTQPSAEGAYP